MKQTLSLTLTASLFMAFAFIACNKNDKGNNGVSLQSPDKSYRVASSPAALLKMIDRHTHQKGALSINNISYYDFNGKWAALVNYTDATNTPTTIIFSKYVLNSVSDALAVTQDDDATGNNKTYSYTCTVKTGCDKCQVQVTDPFSNPKVTCTCDKCQLNMTVSDSFEEAETGRQ
jgi:hypothetical protein